MRQCTKSDNDEVEDEETTSSNTELYGQFVTDILSFSVKGCAIDVCVCSIADKASSYLRAACLPGSSIHQLNFELNAMTILYIEISRSIEPVRKTRKLSRTLLKNAAILRYVTDLKPVMYD